MAFTTVDTSLLAPFATTFIGTGRNRIINGEMIIDQQGAGSLRTQSTGTGGYTVDMLRADNLGGSGTFTTQRVAATPPTGFSRYVTAITTVADATPGAAEEYYVQANVEGYTVRDFLMGTASAKVFTLSFWVRSSLTGTFGVGFSNENVNRSYIGQYTINATNTWEFKTVTLTGDLTGTWDTTTARGVLIRWDLGSGANKEGTAGVWSATNTYRVSGNQRVIATGSATWDITGVQLELGPIATPFEHRPFQLELTLCQRYYEKTYQVETAIGTATGVGGFSPGTTSSGAGATFVGIQFQVRKRASPTMTGYSNAGTLNSLTYDRNGASGSVTPTFQVGETGGYIQTSSIGANWVVAVVAGQWIADARL